MLRDVHAAAAAALVGAGGRAAGLQARSIVIPCHAERQWDGNGPRWLEPGCGHRRRGMGASCCALLWSLLVLS